MREVTHDPRQGFYTVSDRDKLPAERRTELIDGVIYDMASPSRIHQLIAMKLSQLIQTQIDQSGCPCLAFIAPLDVALDQDVWTRVQPDFFVICHPVAGSADYIDGAPEFVVEILSPSTRRKDQQVKSRKYASAGVQEYWMIDPESETVTVLYLNPPDKENSGKYAAIYGFHDKIPVGICKEGFILDFSFIAAAIQKARDWGMLPS